MIVWILAFIIVAAIVGIVLLWPRTETITYKHRAPKDIKQWSPPTPDPVSKHYVDHTSEFSAIPHGANKHYVDATAEHQWLGSRTDTVAMQAVKPDTV